MKSITETGDQQQNGNCGLGFVHGDLVLGIAYDQPDDAAYCGANRHKHKKESESYFSALLADVSQSLLASTGVLTGNHPHVDADLLASLKPCRSSDDQHLSQGRKRPHTGMGHQSQNLGSLPGFPLHSGRQLCNRRIQTVQQLQQLLPAPTRPGSQRQLF